MFFTLEGPDGAGKSTLAATLRDYIVGYGKQCVLTREPGGSPLGPTIRQILLESESLDTVTELFLFLADRANHVSEVIKPALAEKKVVLCDRYVDSTLVYQGYAGGQDLNLLRQLCGHATGGLMPKMTVLLDVPASVGLSRITSKDRIDAKPLEYHESVRRGFLDLATSEPDRFYVVDGTQEKERIAAQVWAAIRKLL